MKILALLIIVSFASVCVASDRQWQDAKVAAITSRTIDNGAAAIPVGGSLYAVRLRATTTYYYIQTDKTLYVLAWVNKRHPLNVTLHGDTKISVDSNGRDAHILDDGGKDVKVPIAEKVARDPESDKHVQDLQKQP